MIIKKAHENPLQNAADLVVICCTSDGISRFLGGKRPAAAEKWQLTLLGKDAASELKKRGFSGKASERILLRSYSEKCRYVLLLGVPEADGAKDLRPAGHFIGKTVEKIKAESAFISFQFAKIKELTPENLTALIEEIDLAGYSFDRFKKKKANSKLKKLIVDALPPRHTGIIRRAKTITEAVRTARDLVNLPASVLTPSHFVREIKRLTKGSGLRIQVLDKKKLIEMKAGGLLGVSAGSVEDPYLVKITYSPKGKKSRGRIALVGKGITFDTGGNSIKPAPGMTAMKCDMAGGAAVLATMKAVSELAPAVEVRGYIPIAENMISGASIRPGDVIQILNGTTVEVLNTDAEGRLILADALSLAVKEKPDVILDAATLTGACVVALGTAYSGLFSNSEKLTKQLLECGSRAGEKHWPMPLAAEYRSEIKSQVAELQNIGSRWGGAITAALFLKEFVGDVPWAHFDIAGPAFLEGARGYQPAGGTGFVVRTFLEFIESGVTGF